VVHLLLLQEVEEHQSLKGPIQEFFCHYWLWLKQHRGVVTMPTEGFQIDELSSYE